jgi:hypothetical protein
MARKRAGRGDSQTAGQGLPACYGQVGHPTFSFDPGVVDVGLRSGVADGQQELRDHNVVKERT